MRLNFSELHLLICETRDLIPASFRDRDEFCELAQEKKRENIMPGWDISGDSSALHPLEAEERFPVTHSISQKGRLGG